MYAITIPGYGKTSAPPVPAPDVSFGDQYWNNGVVSGLVKLLAKERLHKPTIVGHFVQGTQLALRMAIDHPDKVGNVIILGGPAKFVQMYKGTPQQYPMRSTIAYIDTAVAPGWFKTICKHDFDSGNYLPEIYSLDSVKALTLWKKAAAVPLPVIVRYLCEFFASDVTLELDKITCPVLVLRSGFADDVLHADINNYVKPQFIDSWNDAHAANPLITVKDIPDAASCIWKDAPGHVYAEIKQFLGN
jgi:pimeloyl-ACP methyl ester carboxylesterase